MNRRHFIATTATSLLAQASPARPVLSLFSKHAAQLNYKDLAKYSRETGFEGVDLTVRPAGHVLPARVSEDLPVAVSTLRDAGLKVPMITTGLTNPAAPEAAATLRAASSLQIPFWKPGYWRFDTAKDSRVDLDAKLTQVGSALSTFAQMSRANNICCGMHNHSGNYVGAPVWDTWQMIEKLDAAHMGFYFDPAHATAEGGAFTWATSLELALRRLKMVAVKDFYWEKKNGKWQMRWCPLGEGMVNWPGVLKRLALAKFSGPLTLHVEYENPDELKAVAQDFATLKKWTDAAYA